MSVKSNWTTFHANLRGAACGRVCGVECIPSHGPATIEPSNHALHARSDMLFVIRLVEVRIALVGEFRLKSLDARSSCDVRNNFRRAPVFAC